MACIREKCKNPCLGSCGIGANCNVINHIPICNCPADFTGNSFISCHPKPRKLSQNCIEKCNTNIYNLAPVPIEKDDPCNPSPCGPNAICKDGICSCTPEYRGDPFIGCRPECVLSNDCPKDRACIRNKCIDPCPGTCGQNAECLVVNHIPMCSCITGYTGNAFVWCSLIIGTFIFNSEKIIFHIIVYRNNYNPPLQSITMRTQRSMQRNK